MVEIEQFLSKDSTAPALNSARFLSPGSCDIFVFVFVFVIVRWQLPGRFALVEQLESPDDETDIRGDMSQVNIRFLEHFARAWGVAFKDQSLITVRDALATISKLPNGIDSQLYQLMQLNLHQGFNSRSEYSGDDSFDGFSNQDNNSEIDWERCLYDHADSAEVAVEEIAPKPQVHSGYAAKNDPMLQILGDPVGVLVKLSAFGEPEFAISFCPDLFQGHPVLNLLIHTCQFEWRSLFCPDLFKGKTIAVLSVVPTEQPDRPKGPKPWFFSSLDSSTLDYSIREATYRSSPYKICQECNRVVPKTAFSNSSICDECRGVIH